MTLVSPPLVKTIINSHHFGSDSDHHQASIITTTSSPGAVPTVPTSTMRVKNRTQTGHLVDGECPEDDFVAVKTRPPTPVLSAGDQQQQHNTPAGAAATGGFWLAAVNAASGGAVHPLDGCNETGFINSQPSMAEFMTALPHLSNDMQGPPVGPLSPQQTPPGAYPMDPHGQPPHGLGSPGVNVPEYPWMKEKKTTRKNSQQGNVSNIHFNQN